jgi:hypothetical protein
MSPPIVLGTICQIGAIVSIIRIAKIPKENTVGLKAALLKLENRGKQWPSKSAN